MVLLRSLRWRSDVGSSPGWQATPPSASSPHPSPYPVPFVPPSPRPSGARRAVVAIVAIVAVFGAALVGVIVGTHIASPSKTAPSSALDASPPAPSPETVRTQTADLCTRFATAYAAIPSPQNIAADVLPAANYIAEALRDNAHADADVRTAVTKSLRMLQDHGAALSREPSRGAVQPPTNWTAAAANAADDAVWSSCYGYEG